MMDNKLFQKVFNEIATLLPSKWDKVVIYLEHGEESYSYSFFVENAGAYTKCFDMDNFSEDEMFTVFSKIEKIVSIERVKCKALWSNMTMVVDSTGAMKTDFDYTDLSNGSYQYKKLWKKKYLV